MSRRAGGSGRGGRSGGGSGGGSGGRPPGGRGSPGRGGGRGGAGGSSGRGGARSAGGRSGGTRGGAPGSRSGGGRPDRATGPRPTGRTTPPKERGVGGTQVEGRQAVRELLLAGRRTVYELLVAGDVEEGSTLEDIVELADELRVPVTSVSAGRLESVARTEAPQGVVARAAELPDVELADLVRTTGRGGPAGPPFLLAVDGVTDPGNLGALLRIAECAGVTGVVLPRHRTVHVTPTVTKAAAGAVEYLSFALPAGLPRAVSDLRELGVWVVGLDADGPTPVHDLAVADQPVCLVVGAEGPGLSRLVRERCDVVASIPLHGRLASLNVASAGAIACYEVARRRA